MTIRFATAGFALLMAASPAAQPAAHQFVPERFYNTFSGAHPPALRIKPGERVVTKTVDAAGTDWNGNSVASGPNPQTGPFYIEGAEPGDAIVITIDKIETNRPTGFSSSLLAPYTVDPALLLSRVDREPRRVIWNIDKAKGIARLEGLTSRRRSRSRSGRCSDVSARRPPARRPLRPTRQGRSAATWTMRV